MSSDTVSYDSAVFEELASLEERSFWFRSRAQLLAWTLKSYFPTATSFLEVGGGTGNTLAALAAAIPELTVTGGELYREGLEVARRRLPGVELLRLDARSLPFRDRFDVVGAFDVLEHIADDDVALRSLRSAVRPDGGIVITVPQHPSLWSAADDVAHHERRYTRADLLAKLRAADFEPVRVTSFVSFLLPLMIASRRLGARDPQTYDFRREFMLPRPVDRTLGAVLAAERALIRWGFTLPLGGSLLVVAKAQTG
jgi:SAM-dependent methyltransferase